jgi:YVTN family beta-propeller protein
VVAIRVVRVSNPVVSSEHAMPTGTVTMLFTDIEGSTALLKQLGERYGELLADHRRLLRGAFAAHGGRELDTQGDAFFYAFGRARGAVAAAVEGQRALAAYEWPGGVECRIRMGLHTGEPSVGEEGYHGIGLHRGARIAATAGGGQILLSSATAELIHDDLPAGVSLRDLGERQLKDIERPEHVYQVLAEGLPAEAPRTPARRSGRGVAIVTAAGAVVFVVAATAVILAGRGGSPSTASAAAVSSDAVGIFDPRTGHLEGQIPVGASPSALTTGADSVWVANVGDHSVSRIDPAKQVVIQTFQVGNGPAGIAYGGGFVWVTNALDGTVTQIDPGTNTVVDDIAVGNQPTGIAVGGRYVWVANSSDSSVSRISLASGKALSVTIPVDGGANGIAVGDGSVWVTGQASGTVTRIDERSGNLLTPIHTDSGANAIAVGAGAVWVANSLDGTLWRIDPATNTVGSTIPVGDGPSGVAVAPNGVWVSNAFAGTVWRIDPARNVPDLTLTTGNRPAGIAVDPEGLYVAVRTSGSGHEGGTLRLLVRATYLADGVDPALAFDAPEVQIATLTNDGLVGYRKTGGAAGLTLVPDLAVSIPASTDGGRSYTFQLRPGIRYSTGALVRPQDFRAGIERSIELGSLARGYFDHIMGARACLAAPKRPCNLSGGIQADPGANTVTFRLTSPDPDFLYKLALTAADAVPVGTPSHPRGFVPATGPYKVASFNPKTGVRLVRNPRFREWSAAAQPSGFPDVIDERVGGSMDARVAQVLHGAADLALDNDEAPSPAVFESVSTEHAGLLEISPWDITWALALNTRVPPFDNVSARRAFNYALDRKRLTDLALGKGVGEVSCQVLPPSFSGYRRYCPYTAEPGGAGVWTAPDLARARKLIRSSGTRGQAVIVRIPSWFDIRKPARRYIISVLDDLGYRASVRRFTGKGAGQVIYTGYYPDYSAPGGFIPPTLTCAGYSPVPAQNLNLAEFCDPAIDREVSRTLAQDASDPEAASRMWAKADHDITDLGPWVSFANGSVVEVKSPRLGNYEVNPQLSTLLDQLWVR